MMEVVYCYTEVFISFYFCHRTKKLLFHDMLVFLSLLIACIWKDFVMFIITLVQSLCVFNHFVAFQLSKDF